jgi:hypothetical protein
MSMKTLTFGAVLFAAISIGYSPARAAEVTWNFSVGPSNVNYSASQSFNADVAGYSLTASGFTNSTNTVLGAAPTAALVAKWGGSLDNSETGLGLADDPNHQNEIHQPNLVKIDFTGAAASTLTNRLFTMGSTTSPESWIIYETNTDKTLAGAISITGTTQGEANEISVGQFKYYYIGSNTSGGNVLLSEIEGVTAVPEPATWAMMVLGFFGVGFMAYRRQNNFRMA